jgi:hypothetical protein
MRRPASQAGGRATLFFRPERVTVMTNSSLQAGSSAVEA